MTQPSPSNVAKGAHSAAPTGDRTGIPLSGPPGGPQGRRRDIEGGISSGISVDIHTDIAKDIPRDIPNQVRDGAPNLARGRIIGIASGKGGVGKTWFAVTLAHALARTGRRVLLFDGDLGLANVDIQLGLTPVRDLSAVIAGRARLRDVVLRHDEAGFDVLPGRSGSGALSGLDPAALEHVLDALREAAAGYDVVLLDLGAGLDRAVRQMAAFADTLVVVATEEPTSLTDAYAVLKLHGGDRPGGEARVVVNQAGNRASGERTYATLARACSTFLGRAPALLGVVRRDERVRDAIRRQTPLLARHPNCAAAEDVEAIAGAL